MFGTDIGIDLGTATVLIYVKNKGIVLREPSVVAVDLDTGKILAVGYEAKNMVGRTPGSITSVRPLRDGVIADYTMTEAMLHHFMRRVQRGFSRFFRNRVMICVPSGATDVERRAVLEAAVEVGAKEAYLIEEPMAAAIGANLNVEEPRGKMVVDIGGGTTDIAVISLGGIVVSKSLRIGGDRFDEGIMRYLRKQYSLAIGEQTAENLKIMIGTCLQEEEETLMVLKGRDLVQGLPRQIEVSSASVSMAIGEMVQSLIDGVRNVLELTPPELSADIIDRGIVLTGGGSLLRGSPSSSPGTRASTASRRTIPWNASPSARARPLPRSTSSRPWEGAAFSSTKERADDGNSDPRRSGGDGLIRKDRRPPPPQSPPGGNFMHRGLYAAASAMIVQETMHDVTANNLANVSSSGFRKRIPVNKSFPEVLMDRVEKPSEDGSIKLVSAPFQLGFRGKFLIGDLSLANVMSETYMSTEEGPSR